MPRASTAHHQDLPPVTMVQDAEGLAELLTFLDRAPEAAVDTEADSFFNYKEKVCLIQVTVAERDYLVDPLVGLDLEGLGRFLADPHKTKIFHDGEYDILIMKRDYRFRFSNLFDTRVAAAALGEKNPGLASVLKAHFGIELDKSLQRSNWSQRPLSTQQISYARLDTHFLIPLRERQSAELERNTRMMVVEGECQRLEAIEPVLRSFEPDDFVRIKGVRGLSPGQLQALRELFIMRERAAERRDLPPFKVLSNTALVQLAGAQPASTAALSKSGILSPRQARRIAEEVVAAVRKARELGPLSPMPKPRPKDGAIPLDEEASELHDRLKDWRKKRAQREGYDSSLVVNRHALARLALTRPKKDSDLDSIEGLQDWQVESFGEEILEVVQRFAEDLASGEFQPRSRKRGNRSSRRR